MSTGGSDDINRLLREVEGSVGGAPDGHRARNRSPAPPPDRRGAGAVRVAATAGAVGAALVFALFTLLPFLGAISGAAGAFLGVFVTLLIGRLRRRS